MPIVLTAVFAPRGSSLYEWEVTFGGYRIDIDVQLFIVRNRYLHVYFGWLQRDPLRYSDSLNLYQFVIGNPLSHTDPTGTVPLVKILIWIGIIACLLVLIVLAVSAFVPGCRQVSKTINPSIGSVGFNSLDDMHQDKVLKAYKLLRDCGYDIQADALEPTTTNTTFNPTWDGSGSTVGKGVGPTAIPVKCNLKPGDVAMAVFGEYFRRFEQPFGLKTVVQANDDLIKVENCLNGIATTDPEAQQTGGPWRHEDVPKK